MGNKKIPTLKQYLEDIYNCEELKIPIGHNVWKQVESFVFAEIEKENQFKGEEWFFKNEPQIRELLKISIIQTIKVLQHFESNKNNKSKD